MSGTNIGVPSVLAHEPPRPVPADEFAACPVTGVFRRIGDREYSLTPLGASLLEPLSGLADWAVRNADRFGA